MNKPNLITLASVLAFAAVAMPTMTVRAHDSAGPCAEHSAAGGQSSDCEDSKADHQEHRHGAHHAQKKAQSAHAAKPTRETYAPGLSTKIR
ncbi:MAG: hypothetical protein KGL34_06770 [Gammaproteobacteria bacterium]|nr:hypothetical protein [Gammaproteobacteria bacterium]